MVEEVFGFPSYENRYKGTTFFNMLYVFKHEK